MAPCKSMKKLNMPSHPKSKPQGISKSAKMARTRHAKTAQPFRFLDLPGEIRNNIYRIHCTDAESSSFLSKRSGGRLEVQDALALTNRQIHDELTSTVQYKETGITAYVKDFDFRHIVTFLNKLSDTEMDVLVEGLWVPDMTIVLSFSSTFTGDDCGVEFHLLDRWLNRLTHPTKKGTNIITSYVRAADQPGIREQRLTESFRLRCNLNDPRRVEACMIYHAVSGMTMGIIS